MCTERFQISLSVETANQDLVGYLLENLFGLPSGSEQSWIVNGEFIDKIRLSYAISKIKMNGMHL